MRKLDQESQLKCRTEQTKLNAFSRAKKAAP